MSESLELKYERSGCLEAVREEEALPSETRNTLAVFLQFFFFFFVRVCVSMITLMCICVCESVLPSTACRMEVVKVSGGPNEAELRGGISNVAGPLPLAF